MNLQYRNSISPNPKRTGWPWTVEVSPEIYTPGFIYPKISIITPSFNQGHYIEETILSVIRQNYPNLEFIIIDGLSTDSSVSIIKKYASNITYWISEKDKGQSDAINKGLKICTGEIVNWLNSDDYLYPGALENIGRLFQNKAINVYSGRNRLFTYSENNGEETKAYNGTDIYEDNLYKTIGMARIDQPCTYFRKKIYDDIGLINTNLHFTMDKEFWVKYLLKYGLEYIHKSENLIVNFRLHDASKTVSLSQKFEVETNTLFYALAIRNNNQKIADIIKNNFELIDTSVFSFKHFLTKDEMDKILNYFIYQKITETYAGNNFYKAKTLLNIIDFSLLKVDEIKEIKAIKLRMKLPLALKRIYNKLTS